MKIEKVDYFPESKGNNPQLYDAIKKLNAGETIRVKASELNGDAEKVRMNIMYNYSRTMKLRVKLLDGYLYINRV